VENRYVPLIAITGCSSGFGRATALHMLRQGWQVVATVRREADAASLRTEAGATATRLTVVQCDITRADDVATLAATVKTAAEAGNVPHGLDALVNNAGTAFPAPVELLAPDDLRRQLDINVVGHVAVTQTLLPLLKRAKGVVINVSSVGGKVATPVLGAYNASKFALEALSDSLRVEVAPLGVRVVVIEPGGSPTSIWETSLQRARDLLTSAGEYAPLLDAMQRHTAGVQDGFPPERFAQLVERIVRSPRPKPRYALPADVRRFLFLRRFISDRLLDRLIRRNLKW